MATRQTMIAIVAAVAILGTACTSGADEPTTTTSSTATIPIEVPDLEFGSGEVPFTVPAGFPVPDSAVIGSTLIDGVNGRTEMIINFPATVPRSEPPCARFCRHRFKRHRGRVGHQGLQGRCHGDDSPDLWWHRPVVRDIRLRPLLVIRQTSTRGPHRSTRTARSVRRSLNP